MLIGTISKKLFLSSIKKAIILFVLCSMTVNGFIYGATEASRYSFIAVAASVAGQTINQIFSKCNDSLIAVTNKISEEINELVKRAFGREAGEFSGSKEGKKEERGASGNGATGEITITEMRKQISDIKAMETLGIIAFAEKLFKLYMNYKIAPGEGGTGLIVMAFIMFIASIRHRKGITACERIICNMGRKIRISA